MAYLLCKLLFCDFLIDTFTQLVLRLIGGKRITKLLVYIPLANEIVQEIPYAYTTRYKKIDYLKNSNEFKKLLIEDYQNSFRKTAEMFKGKSVKFVTNKFIFRNVLVPLYEEGILKFAIVTTSKKKQIPEKLVFISPFYIYSHLFDRTFWRKIFKTEEVSQYVLTFN